MAFPGDFIIFTPPAQNTVNLNSSQVGVTVANGSNSNTQSITLTDNLLIEGVTASVTCTSSPSNGQLKVLVYRNDQLIDSTQVEGSIIITTSGGPIYSNVLSTLRGIAYKGEKFRLVCETGSGGTGSWTLNVALTVTGTYIK